MLICICWFHGCCVFLRLEKEEKRLRKESSLLQKLEKQMLKKNEEHEVQQEEKESKGTIWAKADSDAPVSNH